MLLLTLCTSPGASSSRIDIWHCCWVTGYAHLHFSCMLNCCSCVRLCDPMDCSLSGSSVRGFSRQECWSGLPCPFLWDLSDPEIEPVSPASKTLKAHFFTHWVTSWVVPDCYPKYCIICVIKIFLVLYIFTSSRFFEVFNFLSDWWV